MTLANVLFKKKAEEATPLIQSPITGVQNPIKGLGEALGQGSMDLYDGVTSGVRGLFGVKSDSEVMDEKMREKLKAKNLALKSHNKVVGAEGEAAAAQAARAKAEAEASAKADAASKAAGKAESDRVAKIPWSARNAWGPQTGAEPWKGTDLTSMSGIKEVPGRLWEGLKSGHMGTLAGTAGGIGAATLLGSLLFNNKKKRRQA